MLSFIVNDVASSRFFSIALLSLGGLSGGSFNSEWRSTRDWVNYVVSVCVCEWVSVVGRKEKPPHYAAITNRRKTLVNHWPSRRAITQTGIHFLSKVCFCVWRVVDYKHAQNLNQRRRRWTLGCGIDPFFLFFFEDGALREGVATHSQQTDVYMRSFVRASWQKRRRTTCTLSSSSSYSSKRLRVFSSVFPFSIFQIRRHSPDEMDNALRSKCREKNRKEFRPCRRRHHHRRRLSCHLTGRRIWSKRQ